MTKCPRCSASLPVGAVFFRAGMLGGRLRQIRCPNCGGGSYIARNRRNALVPLIILVVGLLASVPSPLSYAYLSSLPHPIAAIIRAEIWAVTTLIAIALFAFASRLTPSEPEGTISLRGLLGRTFAVNLAIQIPVLLVMFLIMRDLLGRS